MANSSPPPGIFNVPDGIEVVELAEVDLDFAVEEAFRQGTSQSLDSTRIDIPASSDIGALELFHGVDAKELAALAPRCQSIHAIPGYVLLAPGRLNTKVFFVLDGQLRLYPQTPDKRPVAIVDVGHSTGLRSALSMQPLDHSVITTEISHILAIDVAPLDELNKRHHGFARNYNALLASYVRGDHCVYIGAQSSNRATKHGYVDELTLLHNQHWLDTMFARLTARYRLNNKSLAVAAFAVDKLDEIVKTHGIGPGLRVLEAIGRWLLDRTRPTDILAIDKNRRFIAFLSDCDLNGARILADRLKTEIKTLSIPIASPKALGPVTITVSLGIVALEEGMKDNDVMDKAEALIRKSMSLGGDRLSETL